MSFENLPRRLQRWKVIIVRGAKSYESWDEMVTSRASRNKSDTTTRNTASRLST